MKYKKQKQYRLPNYDYSGDGNYFVTICVDRHKHHFGEIIDEKIILSDLGKLVEKIWNEIPGRFVNIALDNYQVMPDHFHGIVIIKEQKSHQHLINQIPAEFKSGIINNPMEINSISLGGIIRWFKGRVKFEANKINPDFKWQSRYYERVIRNDKEFFLIQEYINNNPINWGEKVLDNFLNRKKL
jgi:REP element-mobilizing transposase RayT